MEDISIDSARLKGKGTDLMDSGSAKPFSRGNDEESVAERQRFVEEELGAGTDRVKRDTYPSDAVEGNIENLSLIHISEPTRLGMISYAVFCLKKKKKKKIKNKSDQN